MTTISVTVDPDHPTGGYAYLKVTGTEVAEAVEVTIQTRFTEKFLSPTGWQSAPAAFGPYEVLRTSDGADVRIGPEIVNQVEEYTDLQVTVGSATGPVNWPDSVPALPGAAAIGGLDIRRGERKATPTPARPRAPEPVLSNQMAMAESVKIEDDTPPPPKPKSSWSLLAAMIILLALVGLAWIYWTDQGPGPEVTDAPCAPEALDALKGAAFEHSLAWFNRCGNTVTAESALALVEDAADENDAAALALFGKLYDAEALDGPVEDTIGLSFDDDPVVAAEYYARANEAGSDDSQTLLAALCERIDPASTTLAESAHRAHCAAPE